MDRLVLSDVDLDIQHTLGTTAGYIFMNVATYGGGVPFWALANNLSASHPLSKLPTAPVSTSS